MVATLKISILIVGLYCLGLIAVCDLILASLKFTIKIATLQ